MILDNLLPMLTGLAAVLGFMALYTLLTPHNEQKLINKNNVAASIAFVGVLIGYGLTILGLVLNALPYDEFLMWSGVAAAFQLSVFIGYRRMIPGLSKRIEDGQMAPALQMAGLALVVGMLLMAVTVNLESAAQMASLAG